MRRCLPEKVVQPQCVSLLETVGAAVWVLGTKRQKLCWKCKAPTKDHSTRQTPGIADIYAVLPPPPLRPEVQQSIAVWWEVKAEDGRPSDAQLDFEHHCHESRTHYGRGGLVELTEFLIRGGWLKADNVAHYRRPSTPCTEACLVEIDTPSSVVARCRAHGRTHKEAVASRPQEVEHV